MDRVCHFEVPYSDKQRMEKFYSSVFGWQFMNAPGEMPYTFVITTEVDESFTPKRPGGINGGSYPRGEGGGTDSPVIVMEVDSTEQRIKGNGHLRTSQGHRRQHRRIVATTQQLILRVTRHPAY